MSRSCGYYDNVIAHAADNQPSINTERNKLQKVLPTTEIDDIAPLIQQLQNTTPDALLVLLLEGHSTDGTVEIPDGIIDGLVKSIRMQVEGQDHSLLQIVETEQQRRAMHRTAREVTLREPATHSDSGERAAKIVEHKGTLASLLKLHSLCGHVTALQCSGDTDLPRQHHNTKLLGTITGIEKNGQGAIITIEWFHEGQSKKLRATVTTKQADLFLCAPSPIVQLEKAANTQSTRPALRKISEPQYPERFYPISSNPSMAARPRKTAPKPQQEAKSLSTTPSIVITPLTDERLVQSGRSAVEHAIFPPSQHPEKAESQWSFEQLQQKARGLGEKHGREGEDPDSDAIILQCDERISAAEKRELRRIYGNAYDEANSAQNIFGY